MATRAPVYRPAAYAERRSERRHRVVITRANLRGANAAPDDAFLHDLSIYGCRLATMSDHDSDEPVWLSLNDGPPIAAKVMWCTDGVVGCRFDQPIARALLRSLTLTLV